MVQLGFCHVERCVEAHVGRCVGEGPHNAPFSTCTCVRAEVDGLKMSTRSLSVGETRVGH